MEEEGGGGLRKEVKVLAASKESSVDTESNIMTEYKGVIKKFTHGCRRNAKGRRRSTERCDVPYDRGTETDRHDFEGSKYT